MSLHFLANHIVLRERECILEGTLVQWTDRVFCDGTIFLSLDRTDSWTPHVPQALGLKGLLEQAEQQATNNIRLEEACSRLMRELRLAEEHSGMYTCWFNPSFIVRPTSLTCTYCAFLFSAQATIASVPDSSVHICGINGANFAQLPSL